RVVHLEQAAQPIGLEAVQPLQRMVDYNQLHGAVPYRVECAFGFAGANEKDPFVAAARRAPRRVQRHDPDLRAAQLEPPRRGERLLGISGPASRRAHAKLLPLRQSLERVSEVALVSEQLLDLGVRSQTLGECALKTAADL